MSSRSLLLSNWASLYKALDLGTAYPRKLHLPLLNSSLLAFSCAMFVFVAREGEVGILLCLPRGMRLSERSFGGWDKPGDFQRRPSASWALRVGTAALVLGGAALLLWRSRGGGDLVFGTLNAVAARL